MKKLFVILVLILNTNLYSQITLTSSTNPTPGNSFLNINCDTVGISEGNSGANQSWNFASLVLRDSNSSHWVASNTTPYSGQFSGSNIAVTQNDTDYNYFTSSASSIISNGFGSPGLIFAYSNPQTYMQYPFTYSNIFTDNFSGSYLAGGSTVYQSGTSTVSCDAWGTLTLPNGTFNNAIRVKYTDVTKDSSFVGGVPFVAITNNTSYAWFVANKKFPVFQIGYSNSIFNGNPQGSFKSVDYSPNNPTIGISQISSLVIKDFKLSQNYPNPFNPTTKIRFDVKQGRAGSALNVNLVIFDELGKEIETLVNESLSEGSYEVNWNAANLPSGIYFYKLTSGEFSDVKKMTLLK